jgi:peptidyl-prolyl cis-trans isomerase B (cyclophilin B)
MYTKKNNLSWSISLILLILISCLSVGGCSTPEANSSSPTNNAAQEKVDASKTQTSNAKMTNQTPKLSGKAKIKLVVNGSPIVIEVDGDNAPVTAGNFVDLVERKVYDGLVFHRVIKEPQPFVAQGGDPQGKDPNFPVSRLGTGGFVDPQTQQRRFIPLEIKLEGQTEPTYSKSMGAQAGLSSPPVVLKHDRGAVAMARSQAPDSASSQFYIALADLGFLDGDYAVFGKVIEGMDVVDRINQGDRIESAQVIEGADKLKK